MYNDIYPLLKYHTQYFYCPKNPQRPPIHPSLYFQPLATTDLFIVSKVLSFPECYIVGIIQYVAFLDWVILLSSMHLTFLHIFS